MNLIKTSLIAAAALLVTSISEAPAQNGPVAGACATESKCCKGLPHAQPAHAQLPGGEPEKASPACREVLDTTSPATAADTTRGSGN